MTRVDLMNIIIAIRDVEQLLINTYEEENPHDDMEDFEKQLYEQMMDRPPVTSAETAVEIFAGLNNIENSIHCLVKETAISSCEDMLQYKRWLFPPVKE